MTAARDARSLADLVEERFGRSPAPGAGDRPRARWPSSSPIAPAAATRQTRCPTTDRYDDRALPEEAAAYDRRREGRQPTPRESQRYADRYGYAEPYGWSEDKARQYSVPERHGFGPFIRAHGFGLA